MEFTSISCILLAQLSLIKRFSSEIDSGSVPDKLL